MYNLQADTIKFITSFLTDRLQVVVSNSSSSCFLPLNYGVPQGSVLGPLLFSIYINDLPLSIQACCELFADDTTIHSSHSDLATTTKMLQDSVDNLVEWAKQNHMSLHPSKTKSMLITTRQKRQNMQTKLPPLFINNHQVEEVDSHKVLGVTIDNNLSWTSHLSVLSKTVSKKVYMLTKIKHFLNLHARKLFFHAHIQSIIDYASTVWDSASANTIKHLNSLHKRALKLVLLKSNSLTFADYKRLDILPLKYRLQYNKGVMMHKIISGCAPSSLISSFKLSHSHHSRKLYVQIPRIDLFKGSLTYSGAILWNSLPDSLRTCASLISFKQHHQQHLMKRLQESFKL